MQQDLYQIDEQSSMMEDIAQSSKVISNLPADIKHLQSRKATNPIEAVKDLEKVILLAAACNSKKKDDAGKLTNLLKQQKKRNGLFKMQQ